MNIFFRELKAHRTGLIWWNIGMINLVVSGVAKFYGYSNSGTSSITNVLDMFPHSLQVLFGLNGFDLSKPSGAYGILFMYIAVTAAIHAVLLGTDLISKEERDKTAEFLFPKPVSRTSVITQKLLAGLANIVILNLIALVTSIYTVMYFSKSTDGTHDVLQLTLALFIMQLLFFLFGAGVAAVTKRPKAAAGVATAILLATFILYFTINLNDNIDVLKYLTPFKYFEARAIVNGGHLDVFYILLSSAIMLVAGAATYIGYHKRDLEV